MKKSFLDYMILKEAEEKTQEAKKAQSEVKLSDDSDYKPFIVDREHHSNLRPLIKAFLESDQVPYPGPDGYPSKLTTYDKTKGTITPKLKKKVLYLVGGAVRDHLTGKTPKDFNLATDATPDEIRMILRFAGFKETKPQGRNGAKYNKFPEAGTKDRIFYAKGWDKEGKECAFGVRIKGDEFDLASFRKDSKSSKDDPEKIEFCSLDGDAQKRDFTMNAMYIPLTTADGPNSKLIDPHGGAHHLRNGEVKFVGNPKDRLNEDPIRALRYIRFFSKYDSKGKIPDEYKQAIEEVKDLENVSRESVRDEFVKGLEHPDVDPVKYIKAYKDLGVLEAVFPGMIFKLDNTEDFSDKKEKRLAIAWILRMNEPSHVKHMLHRGKWSDSEINDIVHLIKVLNWGKRYGKDDNFFDDFYPMKKELSFKTHLIPRLLKKWGEMNGIDPEMLDNYSNHSLSTKAMIPDEFFPGLRIVNPELKKLFGRTPRGHEFGDGIKHLETKKFMDLFKKNK